jgi:hypothetical protein
MDTITRCSRCVLTPSAVQATAIAAAGTGGRTPLDHLSPIRASKGAAPMEGMTM